MADMTLLDSLLLGIIEGLTEFLPVSSTGHLILVERWLGLHGPAVDAYSIAIQLGALFAAVVYYRDTLLATARGLLRSTDTDGTAARSRALLRNLILASLPLLIVGYLFGKVIKARLFHPTTVAVALVVGGLLMLAIDWYQRRNPPQLADGADLSPTGALLTGIVQMMALWPGTSRSMSCILGGQLAGLSRAAAADFAFLLALPTLGVATLYEHLKHGRELVTTLGFAQLAVGLAVSFAVGWLVIAAFIRYLRRFGMWPFALYRIAVGLLILATLGRSA